MAIMRIHRKAQERVASIERRPRRQVSRPIWRDTQAAGERHRQGNRLELKRHSAILRLGSHRDEFST